MGFHVPSLLSLCSVGKSFINHTTSLAYNNLVGNVPGEIGQPKSLSFFAIGPNNLSGMIPSSLFNISMNTLSLTDNEFEDIIPPDIGLKMPNLQQIGIGGNEFSGTISASFSNASQLQILDIAQNNFVGQVPASFGDLPDLRWLGLSNNNLGSYSANDLYFITSLTNCSNLEILDMSLNNFGGVLPNSVANLSTQLTKLYLGVNQISGNIPAASENLNNLIVLGMKANLFTGIIPTFLGKFRQLQILALDGNRLSGQIPSSIGNLSQMFQLYLSGNKLEGSIPLSIGNCKNLQYMDISDNSLSGDIPPQSVYMGFSGIIISIWSILMQLFLPMVTPSSLHLGGNETDRQSLLAFKAEIVNDPLGILSSWNESLHFCQWQGIACGHRHQRVTALDLQSSRLNGQLSPHIGNLSFLRNLNLQNNNFNNTIPQEIGRLFHVQQLRLENNSFSGHIPFTYHLALTSKYFA